MATINSFFFLFCCALFALQTCEGNTATTSSDSPRPTRAQQRYADHEIVALIHFNMGTYFNDGDPSCTRDNWEGLSGSGNPASFDPYLLDTDQWANVFQRLGAKHAVLTAKHGCGFLLWPTSVPIRTAQNETIEYSYAVGRPGKSAIQVDVLGQFARSMRKVGLGIGFYYSLKNNFYLNRKDHHFQNTSSLLPGQVKMTEEEYDTMTLGHLRELWTNYGNLTEHWFDSGYTASIQDRLGNLLEELQPDMIVWAGQGITNNTVVWVGTESGFPSGDDIWSTGCDGGNPGHPDSMDWCPKGCDTTLQDSDRWFYVPEDSIRSLGVLVNLYHKTVGRNGVLELDVAVDKTGRIRYDHAQRYNQLGDYIRACYGSPLLHWEGLKGYVIDLDFPAPLLMDRVMLREDQWQGGQRVQHYKIYVQTDGSTGWTEFSIGHSIGNKRIDILDATNHTKPILVSKLRFHALAASDVPWFREIAVFAPCVDPTYFSANAS